MTELKDLIPSAIVLFLAVIGLGVGWGRLKQVLKDQRDMIIELKRGLYRKDGTLVYVTEDHCNKTGEKIEQTMCRKVDELKRIVGQLEAKFEKNERTRAEDMRQISEFIGRVDQFMRGDNNHG